jgi:hypothetical protein
MKFLLLAIPIVIFAIVFFLAKGKKKEESASVEGLAAAVPPIVEPEPVQESTAVASEEVAPVPAQGELPKKKAAPKKSATKKTNNNTL